MVKKVTIRLEDETHKQLRIAAIEQGTTVQAVLERLVREHLRRSGTPSHSRKEVKQNR